MTVPTASRLVQWRCGL